jgi:hypothetical protein
LNKRKGENRKEKRSKQNKNGFGPRGQISAQLRIEPAAQEASYPNRYSPLSSPCRQVGPTCHHPPSAVTLSLETVAGEILAPASMPARSFPASAPIKCSLSLSISPPFPSKSCPKAAGIARRTSPTCRYLRSIPTLPVSPSPSLLPYHLCLALTHTPDPLSWFKSP